MDSIPPPWFQDPELVERIHANDRSHLWPKGAKTPDSPDTRETSLHLWETLKPLRPLLLGILITKALLDGLMGTFAADSELMLPYTIFVMGIVWTLMISLAIPARRLALGGSFPLQQESKLIASAFPRILATTILTSILLLGATLMCVLPVFILLPLVVRAPYEATLGAGPIEAFRRSFRASRAHPTTSLAATNEILNAIIALTLFFILGQLAVSSLEISAIVPQIVISVVRIGVMFTLWHVCLASFLNGDAAMAGALVPENIARLRTPSKPPADRFFLGRLFSAVRMIFPVIGIALIVSHVMGEMQKQSTASLPQPGIPAPEFSLIELDGPTHESSDYLGTPTVLYFWAPWCAPCAGQTVELHALMDEMGGDVDIVSIALSFRNLDQVRDYVRDKEVRYTVLIGDDELLEHYKINSFPTVILLDKDGVVISNWTGVTSKQKLLKEIQHLLDGRIPLVGDGDALR